MHAQAMPGRRWDEERAVAAPRPAPNSPSTERQPWRVFENSLAVQFISRRRQSWSIDTLDEQLKNDVLSGLEAREVIRHRYFELESALRDLLSETVKASSKTGKDPAPGEARLAALRHAAAPGGPLASQSLFLIRFADRMDLIARTLHLIVHGFLEVRESWAGKVTFRFKLGSEKSSFDASDLRKEAQGLEAFTVIALPHLRLISKDMKCQNI